MNKNSIIKKIVIFIIFCAVLIFVDQITKSIAAHTLSNGNNIVLIKNFLSLELVYNSGVAFGMFSNGRVVFCVFTIIACILIELFYIRLPRKKEFIPLSIVSMTAFAGACGNLIDRIKTGLVVDFIALDFGSYSFPRFNCADIYITLSGAALLIMLFVYNEEQLKEAVRGDKIC